MAMAEISTVNNNWLTRIFDRLLDTMVPPKADPEEAADSDRERREFITEMMDACPDAFASERDICQMMHLFPGRF